jgi:hypothetical protein
VDGPRQRKGLSGKRRSADDPREVALMAARDASAVRALVAEHLLRPDADGWRVEEVVVTDSGQRTASRAVFATRSGCGTSRPGRPRSGS